MKRSVLYRGGIDASFYRGRSRGHVMVLLCFSCCFNSLWTQRLNCTDGDTRETDGYNSHCSGPTIKADIEMGVLDECRKTSGKFEKGVLHGASFFVMLF